ncbi:MAG: glycosyltransferase family 9 protein [Steroidobacteraceae bacterium]
MQPRQSVRSSRIIVSLSAPALIPIVIRFGRLGDMVLLSALLNLLCRRFRAPCWLIGSGPWSEQLYRGQDDVARIWSLFGRHTPLLLGPTWWRVIWALQNSGMSPIYVCETSSSRALGRISAMLRLAGVAPERCVFLREAEADPCEHRLDALLRFGMQTPSAFRAKDYPCLNAAPAPCLKVPDEERLECAAWIRTQGWSERPIVLVQPGNRRTMRRRPWRRGQIDDKAWPLSKWSELLRCMQQNLPQAQIVLCGAKQELPLLRRIRLAAGLEKVVGLYLPLPRLIALCEVASCMISVDTGPAHVAAAVGSPLIVLYGASSPRQWLPRGVRGSPVVALGGPPEARHVDDISVHSVFDAWRSLPVRTALFTAAQIGTDPEFTGDLC